MIYSTCIEKHGRPLECGVMIHIYMYIKSAGNSYNCSLLKFIPQLDIHHVTIKKGLSVSLMNRRGSIYMYIIDEYKRINNRSTHIYVLHSVSQPLLVCHLLLLLTPSLLPLLVFLFLLYMYHLQFSTHAY